MKACLSTKCFMLNKDDNKNLSTGSASLIQISCYGISQPWNNVDISWVPLSFLTHMHGRKSYWFGLIRYLAYTVGSNHFSSWATHFRKSCKFLLSTREKILPKQRKFQSPQLDQDNQFTHFHILAQFGACIQSVPLHFWWCLESWRKGEPAGNILVEED